MAKEPKSESEIVLYQTEDGRTRLEVKLENNTVWLTQKLMADLFQTTRQNVSLHLQNIYAEGELQRAATHKEFLLVRQEGKRRVKRPVDYYNLDAIIAVGYRVKSRRGARFRQWATQRLSEYMVKGFVLDEVQVFLDEIGPDMVRLELYADGDDDHPVLRQEMTRLRQLVGSINGYVYGASVPATRSARDYTPRLVPNFPRVAVPLESNQILWQR
jgi:hypothetical protein